MTPRHVGAKLTLDGFADRVNVGSATLRGYISRGEPATNPVPKPCGTERLSGRRWWCERHVGLWMSRRPRPRNPRKDSP